MRMKHRINRVVTTWAALPEDRHSPYWALALAAACGASWIAVIAMTRILLAAI